MKIRPLNDRVIVKRVEDERKTAGGIVIPDTAAEKPSKGKVVAVGPGKLDDNGKNIAPSSRSATRSFSASIRAPNSRWTAMTFCTCAKTTSSASLANQQSR